MCIDCNNTLLLALDLCRPGYNSSNGFEPCLPCPNDHYQSEYGSIICHRCTKSDSGVPECYVPSLVPPSTGICYFLS